MILCLHAKKKQNNKNKFNEAVANMTRFNESLKISNKIIRAIIDLVASDGSKHLHRLFFFCFLLH